MAVTCSFQTREQRAAGRGTKRHRTGPIVCGQREVGRRIAFGEPPFTGPQVEWTAGQDAEDERHREMLHDLPELLGRPGDGVRHEARHRNVEDGEREHTVEQPLLHAPLLSNRDEQPLLVIEGRQDLGALAALRGRAILEWEHNRVKERAGLSWSGRRGSFSEGDLGRPPRQAPSRLVLQA
jgi:hypothetical protein